MKMEKLKLSNQALGALMMALQNSILTQTDIVPVLKGFELFVDGNGELIVANPPNVKLSVDDEEEQLPQFVGE